MNDARTQMLERMYEDETLVGDLAGEQATTLRQWAITTAETYLQRSDIDDATVANMIRAVRTATRVAASNGGNPMTAQAHLNQLLAVPSTTMAIRTTPLNTPPVPWWRRIFSFWRKG
ncbi:MAG: hypothetical protein ACKO83_00820 [Roseiflexaceae bacterium]